MEASKSLYTKHRPVTLEDYSGEATKSLVMNRFSNVNNLPHVIGITGPRGTGKTSLGRILTKFYNCLNPHEDGTPCECCMVCEEVNKVLISGDSRDVDVPGVMEVDATQANKKEDIESIIETVIQKPYDVKYTVLILDEFHMITQQAQNAMLKTLEDIPEHLIVIICTTNPEKILQTIVSRIQFNIPVKRQTVADMVNILMKISKKEGFTVSEKALELIAKKRERVPRECINLLETVAMSYDKVSVENVIDSLEEVGSELYIKFFRAANTDLKSILRFIQELKEKDILPSLFLSGIAEFVMSCLNIKHGIRIEEYTKEHVKVVKELFDTYGVNDFDALLQVIEHSKHYSDKDENMNELIITTTAMRVSKIKSIANGDLSKELESAISENAQSMVKYYESNAGKHNVISEAYKVDLDIRELDASFDITEVDKDTSKEILSAILKSSAEQAEADSKVNKAKGAVKTEAELMADNAIDDILG